MHDNNHPVLTLLGYVLGFFLSLDFFQNAFQTVVMGALWAFGIYLMNRLLKHFEK